MYDAICLKRDHKAKGDGETNDLPAINRWLAEGLATGRPLYAEGGKYWVRDPIEIDVRQRSRKGIYIFGVGLGESEFDLTHIDSAHDVPFLIHCSNEPGAAPDKVADAFHWNIKRIGLIGKRNGPVAQIGEDDLLDAHNSFYFEKCGINNDYLLKPREEDRVAALRMNFTCQGAVNIVANCRPQNDEECDVKDRCRAGAALELRQAQFTRFYGSYSNANHGIRMIDGYSYGNHFDTPNLEENATCIVIDSSHAHNNKFTTGTFVGNNGLDFRQGSSNIVEAPNIALYEGGRWIVSDVGLLESMALPSLPLPQFPQRRMSIGPKADKLAA